MQNELPQLFHSLITADYGSDVARQIEDGCKVHRKTTLRANTLLSNAQEVTEALDQAFLSWNSIPWYSDAFVLNDTHNEALKSLSIYEEGKIYVQSLSSMLPPLVLDVHEQQDICDLCAAPGGKTTEIAALSNGKAYITACEMHEPRAQKLEFNLKRQGVRNATVMHIDARNLDEFFSFDRILVDAPCSGSGTLSVYNPKQLTRFTDHLLQKSVKSQRALLKKGLSLLRPGGILVYSTCSVLHQENEDVISWVLNQARRQGTYELVPVELPGANTIPQLPTTLEGTFAVCPDELFEGFFVARIKRVQ